MTVQRNPAHTGFTGKVLVVDDTDDSLKLMEMLLANLGVSVTLSKGGHDAIALIASHQFDLVLMDIQMPELSGLEAARALREQGVQVPIVGLSAHETTDESMKYSAAGFDDYVTKPINRNRLNSILCKYLEQKSPA